MEGHYLIYQWIQHLMTIVIHLQSSHSTFTWCKYREPSRISRFFHCWCDVHDHQPPRSFPSVARGVSSNMVHCGGIQCNLHLMPYRRSLMKTIHFFSGFCPTNDGREAIKSRLRTPWHNDFLGRIAIDLKLKTSKLRLCINIGPLTPN